MNITTITVNVLVAENLARYGGGYCGIVVGPAFQVTESFIAGKGLYSQQSFKDVRRFTLEISEETLWEKGNGLMGAGGFHYQQKKIANLNDIPDYMGVREGVVDWFNAVYGL